MISDINSGAEMYYDDAVNKSDADSGSDAYIESDNMLYEGDEETQVAENDKLDVNKQISDSVSYDNEITGDNISAVSILAMVWLAGMLIIAIIIAVRYIPVYMKKHYAIKHVTEKNVYVWPDNTGACTIGIIRPLIYILYGLGEQPERMMIAHERTHIRRKDHILAAGYMAALLINWLNPLMWAIVYRCRKDIELACDEEVLAGEDAAVKKIYAELLIQRHNENNTDSFPVLLSFGFGDIRTRIGRECHMVYRE